MPLFRITSEALEEVLETTFAEEEISERGDLQRWL